MAEMGTMTGKTREGVGQGQAGGKAEGGDGKAGGKGKRETFNEKKYK